MIQSALVAFLQTLPARVYANVSPPQAQLPLLVVDLDSSFRNRHWAAGQIVTGLIDTDFEIAAWSANAEGAYALGAQVVTLLENFSGPLLGTDSPATEYSVAGIEINSESSGIDGKTKLYNYSVFIVITHTTG